MKLFGYEINKAVNKPKLNSQSLPEFLQNFFYGREWINQSDVLSLLKAYRSWVYIAASRNAAAFAAVPIKLFVAKETPRQKLLTYTKDVHPVMQEELINRFHHLPYVRKAQEIGEIVEHPILNLLYSVNNFMNKTDLFELTDLYQELSGNAYWFLIFDKLLGIPTEIWPLPPDKVTIIPDKNKFIIGYKYTNGTIKRDFTTDQIIHFKWPNPMDVYYGMGSLQGVADIYNINQNMNQYENAVFSNSGRLDGYFTTEQEMDEPSFKRLKREVTDTWTGIANAGKTGLFDFGLEYKPVNLSPRELSFMQGRRWTKAEIFEAFDTPMGLFDEKANRANAEAAQFTYMKYGIQPRLRRFEEKLNERFVPLFDEKLFLAFDEVIPADNEFRLKEDTEYIKSGVKLINEVRNERGWKPVEGGDVPYLQMQYVPLGTPPKQVQQVSVQTPEQPSPGKSEDDLVTSAVNSIVNRVKERLFNANAH